MRSMLIPHIVIFLPGRARFVLGRQRPSLKHDKFLIYEQRVCGKQDRHMLGFYEDSREETQEKGKILEENAQAAQEESAR